MWVKTMQYENLNEVEVKEVLENVIMEVSKGRIAEKLDFEASLMEEHSFNSIDIMDILLGIQEKFSEGDLILDVSKILEQFYQGYNASEMTANILLGYLMKLLRNEIE